MSIGISSTNRNEALCRIQRRLDSLDDSCRSSASTESQGFVGTKRKQLNVSFASHCQVRVYAVSSSTKTKSRAWYSEVAYIRFHALIKEIRQASEYGKTIDGEDMSTGIFSMDRSHAASRIKRRLGVWDVVLNGQDAGQSPDMIAAECESLTRTSARESELAAILLVDFPGPFFFKKRDSCVVHEYISGAKGKLPSKVTCRP